MIDWVIFGLKVLACATIFLFLISIIVKLFMAFVDWLFSI